MIRRALRGGRVVPRRSNPSDDPLEVQMRLAEDVWSNGSWEADDVRSAVRLILKAERVAVEASTLASQPVLKGVEYFRALASSSNAARRAMPIRHSAINSAIVAPMRQLTGFSLGSVVNVEDDYGEPTGQLLFPTWPEDRVLVAAARRAPAKAAAAFQAAAAPPPLRALPAHASLTAEQEAAINAAEAVFGYAGEILETVADPQLQGALRRLETTGAATSGGVGATFARNLRREAERRAFYAGQVESADVSMLALPALFRAAVGTGVVTVKDIVPPPPPERAGLISALGANALQAGRALAKPDRPAALRAAAFVLDAAERLGGWPALVRADKWLERLRISPPEVNKYRLLLNDLRARRAAYVLEASRVADVPIIERRAYAVEATVGVEDELAGAGPGVATKHIKRKLAAEFSFRGWKTVRDGSIGGGAELVSPVLAWPRDGKLLAGVIAGAQFAGLRPCGSCGLHVHVGAKDLTWKMLKTLVVLGQRWRHELRLLCSDLPGRKEWADDVPLGAFASLESARNERELWCAYYGRAEKCALPSKKKYDDHRYRVWNLHARRRIGTVEFRVADASSDPQRVLDVVSLAVAQVLYAKRYPLGDTDGGPLLQDAWHQRAGLELPMPLLPPSQWEAHAVALLRELHIPASAAQRLLRFLRNGAQAWPGLAEPRSSSPRRSNPRRLPRPPARRIVVAV